MIQQQMEVESMKTIRERIPSKKIGQSGMTLIELLVTLGILSILLFIGMIAIVPYQRGLTLLEMDETAKELFIASQNRLTVAKASGTWEQLLDEKSSFYFGESMEKQPSDYPTNSNFKSVEHDYRYLVYDGDQTVFEQTALGVLLPYGSIEEEVRENGCYVIEYDAKTANIYGVFYTKNGEDFQYTRDIMGDFGLNQQGGRDMSSAGKEVRKHYKNNSGTLIIGYCGGSTAEEIATGTLTPLKMEIQNEDTLKVVIKDENYNRVINGVSAHTKVSVTITGEESKSVKTKVLEPYSFSISNLEPWYQVEVKDGIAIYTLTLDDITKQGGHFADIFSDFIPGENITIEAESFSAQVLCTPVKVQGYTNSLFGAKYIEQKEETTVSKVSIANVRHLQNISPVVSNFPTETNPLQVEQVSDLDWNDFSPNGEEDISIYSYNKDVLQQKKLTTNAFYSIENLSLTEYEGNGYTLSHFKLKEVENGNVGLFATVGSEEKQQEFTIQNITFSSFLSESTVENGNAGTVIGEVKENSKVIGKNLFVIDTTVKSSGVSGGLIGKGSNSIVKQCSVSLAESKNEISDSSNETFSKTASEKYEQGAYHRETDTIGDQYQVVGKIAGGFLGEGNNITVSDCFSSVPVIATENGVAGGFLGKIITDENGVCEIQNSYTGGFTKDGLYSETLNVASLGENGVAGGFLGQSIGNIAVTNSYATTSVYGTTIGGMVGEITTGQQRYERCYVTGELFDRVVIEDKENNSDTNITSKSNFFGMIAKEATLNTKQCYFLDQLKNGQQKEEAKEQENDDQKGVFGLSYKEFVQSVNDSENKPSDGEETKTYAYDPSLQKEFFPFRFVTKTSDRKQQTAFTHYGDWPIEQEVVEEPDTPTEPEEPDTPTEPTTPEEPELPEEPVEENGPFDIGFIYYEYLEDKNGVLDDTFYYHGIGGKQSDNPYDKSQYTELRTQKKGKYLVNGLSRQADTYVREEGYLLLVHKSVDINNLSIKISYSAGRVSELFKATNIDLPEELKDFNAYLFKDNGYFTSSIPTIMIGEPVSLDNPIWGQFKNRVGFCVNTMFGDSIQFLGEPEKESTYFIRSTRHLSNMCSNSSLVVWDGAKNKFIQTLDLDIERAVNGKKQGVSTIPSFGATYVSKSYLTNDGYYKIVGLKTTLFQDIVSGALIENMTLKEIELTNTSYLFASLNRGTIKNLTIENASLHSNTFVNGFLGENQQGNLIGITMKHILLQSSDSINGFINYNNGGFMEQITLSDMEIDSASTVNGFIQTVQGPISDISMTDIKIHGTKDVNGFSDYNNGGKIEGIVLSNIEIGSETTVNGFLKKAEGNIFDIVMENIKLYGAKNVNGFLQENNGAILKDISITDLALQSNEMANGFVNATSGTISNVKISSLSIVDSEVTNGFVNKNTGTLESCTILPKTVSKTAYQDVSLQGKTVIGFVYVNTGTIKNCSLFGTLSGEQNTAGFIHTNDWQGRVDSCYVNGIMTANEIASGFLLSDNNGTILNSFVVGEITSSKENIHSVSAGFVYKDDSPSGTYKDCYAALWKMEAVSIYRFGLFLSFRTVENCFWLEDTTINGEVVTELNGSYLEKGVSISFDEFPFPVFSETYDSQ